jgi:thiol-disulfide isomerase/thioredoxin
MPAKLKTTAAKLSSAKVSSTMPKGGKVCSSPISPIAHNITFVLLLLVATTLFILIFLSLYRAQRDSMRRIIAMRRDSVITEAFDESAKARSGTVKVYFFFMQGCGWCERFTPVWDEFVTKRSSTPGLVLRKVDKNEPLAKEYSEHVNGYPTVLLVDSGGKVVKFTGERTLKGLEAFILANGVKETFSSLSTKAEDGDGEEDKRIVKGGLSQLHNRAMAISKNEMAKHRGEMDGMIESAGASTKKKGEK